MTLEQARIIIGSDVIFESYVEWRQNGGSFHAASVRQRPEGNHVKRRTIIKRLEKAQSLINAWAVTQNDTHTDADTENEHTAECRELCIITVAEGHEARTLMDNVCKKILLRSA